MNIKTHKQIFRKIVLKLSGDAVYVFSSSLQDNEPNKRINIILTPAHKMQTITWFAFPQYQRVRERDRDGENKRKTSRPRRR